MAVLVASTDGVATDGVAPPAAVRAVNDKTAKDLLGEQFRRQMLMDGQYGTLAFVATQSDVIERSEAIRSLRLPAGASLRECAERRNEYTRRRLRQDFKQGLRELAEQAGDTSFDQDAFDLPVFTVSSLEYQVRPYGERTAPSFAPRGPRGPRVDGHGTSTPTARTRTALFAPTPLPPPYDQQKLAGLRPNDGAPRVWSDVEQTMVPKLVRHVQRAALARRKVITRRRCEAMRDFAVGVLRLLEQASHHFPPRSSPRSSPRPARPTRPTVLSSSPPLPTPVHTFTHPVRRSTSCPKRRATRREPSTIPRRQPSRRHCARRPPRPRRR